MRSGTERAAALPEQLRDVSRFMEDLQQQFTRWFNRTRPVRRRGHLWQERFNNTIKNVMARARSEAAVAKRRLTRALTSDPPAPQPEIHCFKRLREIV